jgi:hypothetical protein
MWTLRHSKGATRPLNIKTTFMSIGAFQHLLTNSQFEKFSAILVRTQTKLSANEDVISLFPTWHIHIYQFALSALITILQSGYETFPFDKFVLETVQFYRQSGNVEANAPT